MADKRADEKSQSQKFIDKVRELDVDEIEEAFDEKLKRATRKGPQPTKDDSDKDSG
jgi:hypothetical protein